MDIGKRGFIKGLFALAGLAAVGPVLPKLAQKVQVAYDPCTCSPDGVCNCGMTFHRATRPPTSFNHFPDFDRFGKGYHTSVTFHDDEALFQ